MARLGESKKLVLLWVNSVLRKNSISMTHLIARRYGTQIGFTYVGGYPKSGTTWISQLVAHYLDLPIINPVPPLPLTFKCVIHHHWSYHPALDHSVYVTRDGRDVMISLYMNLMKNYIAIRRALAEDGIKPIVKAFVENVGTYNAVSRRFQYLFGRGFDPWDLERNLPTFLESEMEAPFLWAVRQSWPEHVRTWHMKASRTTFVKYEDMLQDCTGALASLLAHYLGTEVDQQEITYTAERYSFARQSGRAPGIEDRSSFARKGIQGDWRNYFTPEARQVFEHYAGDLLIELGYEPDNRWVNDVSR